MFLIFGPLSLLFCKLLRIQLRFAYVLQFFLQGVNKVLTFVLFEFSLIALYYLGADHSTSEGGMGDLV